jgi:integrase
MTDLPPNWRNPMPNLAAGITEALSELIRTLVTPKVSESLRWALERITLHECRHTFASIAIAAGVNIGTVSAALGHASVTITWDRYHHLMPGTMDQAAELIQVYISQAISARA